MKTFVIIAGLATLAACNKAAPAPEPTATESAAAAPTLGNGSTPGVYESTGPDGAVRTSTLNADGSYTDTDATGKILEEGSWAVTGGKTCFTPTTKGATAMCFAISPPAADGSFTATPDKGDAVKITPVPAEDATDVD